MFLASNAVSSPSREFCRSRKSASHGSCNDRSGVSSLLLKLSSRADRADWGSSTAGALIEHPSILCRSRRVLHPDPAHLIVKSRFTDRPIEPVELLQAIAHACAAMDSSGTARRLEHVPQRLVVAETSPDCDRQLRRPAQDDRPVLMPLATVHKARRPDLRRSWSCQDAAAR